MQTICQLTEEGKLKRLKPTLHKKYNDTYYLVIKDTNSKYIINEDYIVKTSIGPLKVSECIDKLLSNKAIELCDHYSKRITIDPYIFGYCIYGGLMPSFKNDEKKYIKEYFIGHSDLVIASSRRCVSLNKEYFNEYKEFILNSSLPKNIHTYRKSDLVYVLSGLLDYGMIKNNYSVYDDSMCLAVKNICNLLKIKYKLRSQLIKGNRKVYKMHTFTMLSKTPSMIDSSPFNISREFEIIKNKKPHSLWYVGDSFSDAYGFTM